MHIYNMELVIPVHQTWENLFVFFQEFYDKSRTQFFWVPIQSGENVILFKIPFMLGVVFFSMLLSWFSSFHFPFSICFMCLSSGTCVGVHKCGSISTQMCTYTSTQVCLSREGQSDSGLWLDNSGSELQIHEGKILVPPSGVQLKTIKPQAQE